jgi:hypothetical protein
MPIEQLADIFFGMIQEEAAESIDEPWCYRDGSSLCSRFSCNRIGNTLHVEDDRYGKKYTLTLEEAK